MDFIVLLAYESLAASRTFLQQLLACLHFRLTRFILLVQTKHGLWAVAQTAENHGDE